MSAFARVFLRAVLATAAVFIMISGAIYGVWVIVAPETPHPEIGIPALLLALASAVTLVVLWRRGRT